MADFRRLTERGFPIYLDDSGSKTGEKRVRVQESSRAGYGPYVWIMEGEPGIEEGAAVQLSVRQALIVARGLLAWVDDAIQGRTTESLEGGDG